MTKDEFITKNKDNIIQHYMNEGKDLGYKEEELYDYACDTICFTMVVTKEELEQEHVDYCVIATDGHWIAVETFNGSTYEDVCI